MKPIFRFVPVGLDVWDAKPYMPKKASLVSIASGKRLQKPFTYIEQDGRFLGMVLRASLTRIKVSDVPSWKAGAYGKGERAPSFNALRFATRKEALAYASDLYGRWMGCDRVDVFPSSDPPNYEWVGGRLAAKPLKAEAVC